ncbi:MAG: rod shape-determining protein MreC [Fimbriimonadia bacterium]|nr:rod shape-determining protein MreC [Fimbriimonadia bacterium]
MRKRYWLTLGALAMVGTWIGVYHNHQMAQNKPDPVTGIVRAVVFPIQSGMRNTSDGVSQFFQSIFKARAALSDHERLLEENQKLRMEVEQMQAVKEENEQLSTLMKLQDRLPGEWVACRIVAAYPQIGEQSFTLDKGSKDGIQTGAPIVSGDGLVGVVTEVNAKQSVARLITARGMAVGARVENPAKVSVGVCEGWDESSARLRFLPLEAPIQPGDRVATAGTSGKYPVGIPIGVVEEVWQDKRYSLKEARVKTAARLDNLSVALVLKSPQ